MSVSKARINGNLIYYSEKEGRWEYSDGTDIEFEYKKCPKCHEYALSTGEDNCIGNLEGVKFACCGHGNIDDCYIYYLNGTIIRGLEAVKILNELKEKNGK